MSISLIVAMDKNRLIGCETGLPWHLSADLRRFRKLTTGKPIVMGRKTLEQIGGPLKERMNIVLTRKADYVAPGCTVVHSIEDALKMAKGARSELGADEIMVIGGSEVYRQALPLATRIYLTVVEGAFTGNAWFPEISTFTAHIVQDVTHLVDEKNPFAHRFMILDREDSGIAVADAIG